MSKGKESHGTKTANLQGGSTRFTRWVILVALLVVFLLILPHILSLAGQFYSWFLATELSRFLGIVLTPEQFNLLLDKLLDIFIHIVEMIPLLMTSKFGTSR